MSAKTKIQWCDSTCNPTMGCDGCELWSANRKSCYAGMLHTRFGGVTPGYAPTFEAGDRVSRPHGRSGSLGGPAWKRTEGQTLARRPAAFDLSFGHERCSVGVGVVRLSGGRDHQQRHRRSRPSSSVALVDQATRTHGRVLSMAGGPWPGMAEKSLGRHEHHDSGYATRIKSLLKVGDENTIHFLSVEPQIEEVDLTAWLPRLDWVIQGGESGRKARPFDISWASGFDRTVPKSRCPVFPEATWIGGS